MKSPGNAIPFVHMNDTPPVVHVSPRVQARGGIESLHEIHATLPGSPEFVALFDRGPIARPGYANLDCTWRTPLFAIRRRFARVMASRPGRVVVYHNGWGLPLFHDLDGAARRMVFLHADPSYHAPELPAYRGLVDGVVGISPDLSASVAVGLPELESRRVRGVRVPIRFPARSAARRAEREAELILGYAGRVERAQKRLDRLPALLQALDAAGVRYRFEVVGEGSWRAALTRKVRGRVRFHGWLSTQEYDRVLASWDAAISFSDHEGGPITLLEAMAAGTIAFQPAVGGGWADVLVPQVDPRCHYPPGDMVALARAVRAVLGGTPAQIAALRATCQSMVHRHRTDDYARACAEALAAVAAQPRISAPRPRRPRVTDWLPLGVAARCLPGALRAG